MTIASGLSKMPDIYLMDDQALNAFAAGRDPEHSVVAVTSGLAAALNRDQLQGVIAHEVGHIVNRDVLFMQMLGVMAGAIVMISEGFLRGMFYSGRGRRSRRRSSGGGGGQAQAILMVLALVLALLAPILARVIYLAASRKREYLADAQAALFTRYPEGLASALEAISGDAQPLTRANSATAPMFISNPLARNLNAAGLFSTHPPINARVAILRGMTGNASYAEYERASQVTGTAAHLPASLLGDAQPIPLRAAHPEAAATTGRRRRMREVGDAVLSANKFVFVPCSCGLRIKLPPGFTHDNVKCPKCGRRHKVPGAGRGRRSARTVKAKAQTQPPLDVTRKPSEWMSFTCPCGNLINLSPALQAGRLRCTSCHRKINVIDA